MSGLYVASALTTALAVLLIGTPLLAVTPREERGLVVLLVALELPMCALALHA